MIFIKSTNQTIQPYKTKIKHSNSDTEYLGYINCSNAKGKAGMDTIMYSPRASNQEKL